MLDIKLIHPAAKLPMKSFHSDAGYDVFCCSDIELAPLTVTQVPLGLCLGLPDDEGVYCQIASRSGLAKKGVWVVGGIVDPGYTGELKALLYNSTQTALQVRQGDRVCQLLFLPFGDTQFREVKALAPSSRGSDGLGSTGGILLS